MTNMELAKKVANTCGISTYDKVECLGRTFENVIMFGDNECFDNNGFYQYGVCGDNEIYKFYYDSASEVEYLDMIDYYEPDDFEEVDKESEFWSVDWDEE